MHIKNCFVGMRFRVVYAGINGILTFGDYENGDEGRVRRIEGGHVRVNWDKRRYADESQEDSRCDCLSPKEIMEIE